ncbi:hypothetical protein VX159_09250 [Dechloromonas sp. ZY10]|uniref:hypothetical protein n=1 Tax=Dechloromonas aquae TaxID=2664436 RepID=UPI003528672A
MSPTAPNLKPLVRTWLALFALTLLSLALGHWLQGANWLSLLVAAIIWLKGDLIARHFLESARATPFIARLLRYFIAFTPLALIFTAFFGREFARWATL